MNLKDKKTILEKYIQLIKEYFILIENSNSVKEQNYPLSYLFIGINSIHRVFEHILIKTKSIQAAYYYSQKAYYYYLEYIEQVLQSNISLNLNHIDAILFTYKNTIFNNVNELTDCAYTNLMLQKDTINIDENEVKTLFIELSFFVHVLFYWSNTSFLFKERKMICDIFLDKFINIKYLGTLQKQEKKEMSFSLMNTVQMEITVSYLEIIQQKTTMNYNTYYQLLNEIILKKEKQKKKKSVFISEFDRNEHLFMKFYNEKSVFLEKFESGNMTEFVNWLY